MKKYSHGGIRQEAKSFDEIVAHSREKDFTLYGSR